MRPLSGRTQRGTRSIFLPFLLLLTTTITSTLAAPTPLPLPELDDRNFADILENIGNITQDVGSIIQSVSDIVQTFVVAIKEIKNASTENDLVGLLGMDVQGAEDDTKNTANGTVGAVGTNVTCPGMAVLFARGTTEPGNVGLFTGPSFVTALRNYINGTTSLAVQGVDYPASIPGFLAGGSPDGSFVMASIANKTATACPSTKIVLAGYSQGAQLVHNAMNLINPSTTTTTNPTASAPATNTNTTAAADNNELGGTAAADANATEPTTPTTPVTNKFRFNSAAVTSTVSSVILFGDPRNGTAISGIDPARVLSFCNTDDNICAKGGDIVTLDHLTYNRDAPQAAMFVMQKTALGVASSDATNQGMGNVPSVPVMSGMNGAMQISGNAGLPKM